MRKETTRIPTLPQSIFKALNSTRATARFPLFARAQTENDEEIQKKLSLLKPEIPINRPSTEKLLYHLGFTNREIFDYTIDPINKKIVALRSAYFDKVVSDFLNNTFSPVMVIDLGCGLDNRCQAYQGHNVLWLNVDHPEIIALRELLFEEQTLTNSIDTNKNIISFSANIETEFKKIVNKMRYISNAFDHNLKNASILFISIGVFPYLKTNKIIEILKLIDTKFKHYQVSFEDFSQTLIDQSQQNPDVTKTGAALIGNLSPGAQEKLSNVGLKVNVTEFKYFTYPSFWETDELSKYADEEHLEEVSSRILTIKPQPKQ